MTELHAKFSIGQIVYIRSDEEQEPRCVVEISFRGRHDNPVYTLTCGTRNSDHYEFELSDESDPLIRLK